VPAGTGPSSNVSATCPLGQDSAAAEVPGPLIPVAANANVNANVMTRVPMPAPRPPCRRGAA